MNRVVITGMGWVTPMGHDVESVWKRLLNGESGIARTTLFDASTFPTTFSAEVKNYDLTMKLEVAINTTEETKYLTGKDKFDLLSRLNTNLLDLKNRFNLDIEP